VAEDGVVVLTVVSGQSEAEVVCGLLRSVGIECAHRDTEAIGVTPETVVVERGDVLRAKPEPDLFLACAERMGVPPAECYVVGDAVWDLLAARRAGMLSVGLQSGGYGEAELTASGAFRVYRDAEELRVSLDELGVLP